MWRIGRAPNSILIYIQQDATSYSLFISGNCSTYFGWYFHPQSGAHTTVATASGICHTVTAIWRYRGRVGTCLSVLWVEYATHSTLKPVPTLRLIACRLNPAQHFSGILIPIIRSLSTAATASDLPLERGGSSAVGRGRACRPDHDQQRCYHYVLTVNERLSLQLISSWWWA
jgi:hypothetical protein